MFFAVVVAERRQGGSTLNFDSIPCAVAVCNVHIAMSYTRLGDTVTRTVAVATNARHTLAHNKSIHVLCCVLKCTIAMEWNSCVHWVHFVCAAVRE